MVDSHHQRQVVTGCIRYIKRSRTPEHKRCRVGDLKDTSHGEFHESNIIRQIISYLSHGPIDNKTEVKMDYQHSLGILPTMVTIVTVVTIRVTKVKQYILDWI